MLVDGITNATAVETGEYTSCALLASGRIDCWGGSTWGQLGDGSEESSSTPVEVSGIASAVALGVGDYRRARCSPTGTSSAGETAKRTSSVTVARKQLHPRRS